MTPRSDEAFVLRTGPLGESDLLVTLFTREEGKLRGVARSARKSRRRFGGALEPMTHVRAQYVEREGRDLVQVRELEVLRSFFEVQSDPLMAATFAYVAEIVDQFGREKEADQRFFRLICAVLDALGDGVDPDLTARYFELWTCRFQGILPDLSACSECGAVPEAESFLDPAHSEMRCRRCVAPGTRGIRVNRETRNLVRAMLRQAPGELAARPIGPAALSTLGRLMEAVLLQFVERPFASLRVLREMTG